MRKITGNKKDAFTLIELLVVIAIISLLVSILLPSLQQAKALARQTVCLSHIHQVMLAFGLYHADCNGLYPDYREVISETNVLLWYVRMAKTGYFSDTNILWCPGNERDESDRNGRYKWGGIDHGYNMLMTLTYIHGHATYDPANVADIQHLAETITICDARRRDPLTDEPNPMVSWGFYTPYSWYYGVADRGAGIAVARHGGLGGRCGVGWADGHSTMVTQPDPNDEASLYWPEALTEKGGNPCYWDRK